MTGLEIFGLVFIAVFVAALVANLYIDLPHFWATLWRILQSPPAYALPEPDWAAAADEIGFFEPLDHILLNVSAWTPEEREAYGVNATDILIDAIDKELKGVEWQRLTDARIITGGRIIQSETASEKAIRRNGAQIIASVVDKPQDVWVGPAMNGGAR